MFEKAASTGHRIIVAGLFGATLVLGGSLMGSFGNVYYKHYNNRQPKSPGVKDSNEK